jgi:hypothetical protein
VHCYDVVGCLLIGLQSLFEQAVSRSSCMLGIDINLTPAVYASGSDHSHFAIFDDRAYHLVNDFSPCLYGMAANHAELPC